MYSFGVVMLEMLSGRRALVKTGPPGSKPGGVGAAVPDEQAPDDLPYPGRTARRAVLARRRAEESGAGPPGPGWSR
jgi:hypothetical protein